MNYAEMSDQDINIAVAENLGMRVQRSLRENTTCVFVSSPDGWNRMLNYCNNPSDAWPIIIENKIAIIPETGDGTWWAMYQPVIQLDWRVDADGKKISNDHKPLRAGMIAFLMMKDAENK